MVRLLELLNFQSPKHESEIGNSVSETEPASAAFEISVVITTYNRCQFVGRAIQSVMDGVVVLPAGYQPPRPDAPASDLTARLATLTPQQVRVLQMLRQGLLNKQIAFDLGVGETTVKAHVSEILRKLRVSSRTQAVIEASKIDFDSIIAHAPRGPSS